MTVWLLGGSGTLGRCLAEKLTTSGVDFVAPRSSELDLTDPRAVRDFAQRHPPAYLLNSAAYTAVDQAESEPELARALNAGAVKTLAALGAPLFQVSTDYVFDGSAREPYAVDATCNPLGVYGQTKREGELAALGSEHGRVIRTSWLFGPAGNDFVGNMRRRIEAGEALRVVNDQRGRPTYAPDLAEAIVSMAGLDGSEAVAPGVYHWANSGETTWYELTVAIAELLGVEANITPVDTEAFPTAAERPKYSVLEIPEDAPHWRDALARCLAS